MHQQGGTIENALDSISSHEFVLPAIQREFVFDQGVSGVFNSTALAKPLYH